MIIDQNCKTCGGLGIVPNGPLKPDFECCPICREISIPPREPAVYMKLKMEQAMACLESLERNFDDPTAKDMNRSDLLLAMACLHRGLAA